MNEVMRWFGIVRKKDGKYVFGFSSVSKTPTQREFLKKALKFDRGDAIIELLKSAVWQPKDFLHYCAAEYAKKDGK